jgi:hypothetical protein
MVHAFQKQNETNGKHDVDRDGVASNDYVCARPDFLRNCRVINYAIPANRAVSLANIHVVIRTRVYLR